MDKCPQSCVELLVSDALLGLSRVAGTFPSVRLQTSTQILNGTATQLN